MSLFKRTRDFYAVEQLGPNQSMTPEGFLICKNVPLARIGEMIYGPNETPVSAGRDGMVRITRSPEQVFRAETIASAIGKPVVDDHPDQDVTPSNWRSLSCGIVLHPRRGEGKFADFLVGDLQITTPDAIAAILAGKREVSCGYDAEYYETAPGLGEQRNIIINHVALVERGRCGPACAIGDKEHPMTKSVLARALDSVRAAVTSGNKDLVEAALNDAAKLDLPRVAGEGAGGITINVGKGRDSDEGEKEKEKTEGDENPFKKEVKDDIASFKKEVKDELSGIKKVMDSIAAKIEGKTDDEDGDKKDDDEKKDKTEDEKILGQLQLEAPPGTNDAAIRKARDSGFLEDSFRDVVAGAEILAPGLRVPTFDRAASPKASFNIICHHRRAAMDVAYTQADMRGAIDDLLRGRTFDMKTATCDSVRSLFNAAVVIKKGQNNGSRDSGGFSMPNSHTSAGISAARGKIQSIADLNKANAERYQPAKQN